MGPSILVKVEKVTVRLCLDLLAKLAVMISLSNSIVLAAKISRGKTSYLSFLALVGIRQRVISPNSIQVYDSMFPVVYSACHNGVGSGCTSPGV